MQIQISRSTHELIHNSRRLALKGIELARYEVTELLSQARKKLLGSLLVSTLATIGVLWLSFAMAFLLAQTWNWNVAAWTITGIFAFATLIAYLSTFEKSSKTAKPYVAGLAPIHLAPPAELPLHALSSAERDKALLTMQITDAQSAITHSAIDLKDGIASELKTLASEKLNPSHWVRHVFETEPVPYALGILAFGFLVGITRRA